MKLNINDEQGIEFLHWIFERELKPPFREGEKDEYDYVPCYNMDGEEIGHIYRENTFIIHGKPLNSIKRKVSQAFDISSNFGHWLRIVRPHLISWLGTQMNVDLKGLKYY